MRKPNGVPWFASFVIIITLFQSKLVDTSGSVFLLFKRSQVFKSYFRIESLFWLVFYFLRADPVQAEINQNCGTDLKVSSTIEVHSRPSHGSNKKKIITLFQAII